MQGKVILAGASALIWIIIGCITINDRLLGSVWLRYVVELLFAFLFCESFVGVYEAGTADGNPPPHRGTRSESTALLRSLFLAAVVGGLVWDDIVVVWLQS